MSSDVQPSHWGPALAWKLSPRPYLARSRACGVLKHAPAQCGQRAVSSFAVAPIPSWRTRLGPASRPGLVLACPRNREGAVPIQLASTSLFAAVEPRSSASAAIARRALRCRHLTMRSRGQRGEAIVFPDVQSCRCLLTRRWASGV
jgi:hypothetical protein